MLDESLVPRKRVAAEALLPLIVSYLTEYISYQHVVWQAEGPAPAACTLWREVKAFADVAKEGFALLQRKLIESGVSVLEFAKPASKCPNTPKAKRLDMFMNLDMASRLFQMAEQFLEETELRQILLLPPKYWMYGRSTYHPQGMKHALF